MRSNIYSSLFFTDFFFKPTCELAKVLLVHRQCLLTPVRLALPVSATPVKLAIFIGLSQAGINDNITGVIDTIKKWITIVVDTSEVHSDIWYFKTILYQTYILSLFYTELISYLTLFHTNLIFTELICIQNLFYIEFFYIPNMFYTELILYWTYFIPNCFYMPKYF